MKRRTHRIRVPIGLLLTIPLTGVPIDARDEPSPSALDDRRERLRAVSRLVARADDRAAAELAVISRRDESPAIRAEAVYGLGEVGGEPALRAIETTLLDPDPGVRQAAIEAAREIGGDGAARVLVFAMGDGEASLREAAVHALGEIGGEVAAGFLQRALTDEHAGVREAAAEVLAGLSTGARRDLGAESP
jgi:HEAT repeat protein